MSAPGVPGFRFAAAEVGVRYQGRDDLGLIACDGAASWAGIFTTSTAAGAPVVRARRLLARGRPLRAVLVNAGIANAGTGWAGLADAGELAARCARALAVRPGEVLCASTGAIGVRLPVERLAAALPALIGSLAPDGAEMFGRAIMTTDTRPKLASARCRVGGHEVTVLGVAKGAAMIAPRMATMLAFLLTDAAASASFLRTSLARAADTTFNALTVDGDTSTSDMAVVLASGAAGNRALSPRHPDAAAFTRTLEAVCRQLAREIARDGEGATRLVVVTVEGARNEREALAAARGIASSSLVRAALSGARPAWGFMVAALGAAGVPVVAERLALRCGDQWLVRDGTYLGPQAEAAATRHLAGEEVSLTVDLGRGRASFTCYTCDLTAGYVAINAQPSSPEPRG